ncbi:MAG TPA: hypothetical protein VFV46_13250 [Lacibacter sp.]|nr:hypothetical protein [Lacibacter sp.]
MEQAINDHQFRDWLATELGIRQDEVQNQLQLFIQHFTEALQQQSVVWAGWGRFYKNGSQITFEAQDSIYVPAIVKAERVIRKGAEHPVRVGEDERTSTEMEEWLQTGDAKKKHLWWIIALLMSAAGIILAVLFAGKHNIQWKNNTNYQLLKPKEPQVLYKTP